MHELWTKVTLSVLAALAIHTCIKFSIKKAFAAYSTKSIPAQVGAVWLYGILAFAVMIHYCKSSSATDDNNKVTTTMSTISTLSPTSKTPLFDVVVNKNRPQ